MKRVSFLPVVVGIAWSISAPSPRLRADPEDFCTRVRNDDRLRSYDPALRQGFLHAFSRLFPKAKGGHSDAMLRAEGTFRCMNGILLACYIGDTRPCGRIDRARKNAGATAFCHANPQAPTVPLVASYGSEFTFRCHDGQAEISGIAWTLDERGFAKALWAPMDLD